MSALYSEYRRRKRRQRRRTWSILLRLFITLCVVNFVQQGVLPAARISGDAMSPAIEARDIAYATKFIYGQTRGAQRLFPQSRSTPSYGDVVYIRPPYATERSLSIRLLDIVARFFTFQRVTAFSEPRLVRRIIALPGDTVYMREFQFFVAPASSPFASELTRSPYPYRITPGAPPPNWRPYYPLSSDTPPYLVPSAHYFVAADNRAGALDSRAWGAIPHDAIVAPIFLLRRFPFQFQNIRRLPQ